MGGDIEDLVLTQSGGVEDALGAVGWAGNVEDPDHLGIVGAEREVTEEGVAPDGVLVEEAEEPEAGGGEPQQVSAVQVLGHLRPDVQLIPAPNNMTRVFRFQTCSTNHRIDR